MASTIEILNANAIELAINYYNDATGFVRIMQENWLDDYIINGPIVVASITNNNPGESLLVLAPTDGIKIGDLVYCVGLETYALVLNVEQIFSVQTGAPFCSCLGPIGPAPQRVLPPTGDRVSTNVTITPALDNPMVVGSAVTFAVGIATDLTIPNAPPSNVRGVPT